MFWDIMLCSVAEIYQLMETAASVFTAEEVTGSSKTLISFYQTTYHDIPQDSSLHIYCYYVLIS